jgi:hypothetical protein
MDQKQAVHRHTEAWMHEWVARLRLLSEAIDCLTFLKMGAGSEMLSHNIRRVPGNV